jgi:hypothetical protein
VLNHPPLHARRSSDNHITDEIGCYEINSDAFEPRNLDLIFGNMDNLTEHDTPFYLPREVCSNEKIQKQKNLQQYKREYIKKTESQHN